MYTENEPKTTTARHDHIDYIYTNGSFRIISIFQSVGRVFFFRPSSPAKVYSRNNVRSFLLGILVLKVCHITTQYM